MAEENTEQGPLSSSIGTFESLQSSSNSVRRARPPNIIVGDENKVPLRPDSRLEKLAKRESKIGLRSIFGRQRTTKDGSDLASPTSFREPSRSGGIRASLAEISNWPYSRSELSLASPQPLSSRSTSSAGLPTHPSHTRLRQQSSGKSNALPAAPGSPGLWAPTPLFQIYPQAVKHATLPACTASIDTLLRLNDSRNRLLVREDLAAEESADKNDEEKGKNIHQRTGRSRSILHWANKTYALVTSGYLLQYAADGPFDRMPEKVLRLSKDSAAFASDLIPGRHWVIQVVSSMNANGTPTTESRSFISKLALRGLDKKQVSTLLMVFESAEDMDNWLAVLRREIEELGGKKQLTETGEVRKDDTAGQLKTKTSQRTIVVRDPERFSSVIEQDFSWSNDHALKERDHDTSLPSSEISPEFPTDDGSTTESHYSSDGQALDNLREGNNRFSYISSGQRTFVTSANSSPACSPTRASFSSHPGDYTENQSEVRLRPNAQAISSRRQSMQTIITGFDTETISRRHSNISNTTDKSDGQHSSGPQSVPNFSKRFSGVNHSPVEPLPEQITTSPPKAEPEPPAKSSRKPPPTALAMSRPLSTVMDMPTPISPRSPDMRRNMSAVQENNAMVETPDSSLSATRAQMEQPRSARKTSSSRLSSRFISMTSLRTPIGHTAETASETPRFILSSSVATRKTQFESPLAARQESPRSFSSMGAYGFDRKSTSAPFKSKRSSFLADDAVYRNARHSLPHNNGAIHVNHNKTSAPRNHSTGSEERSPSLSASSQFLNIDVRAKGLMGRRSMPQLAEGPPLLPPPTCALPPIPKKD